MNQKIEITKYAMQQHGVPTTDQSLKKLMPIIWQNPRNKHKGGLGLTRQGFEYLTKAGIKSYTIRLDETISNLTNQEIIWIDQHMDSPFFIFNKKIFVFTERSAIELVLFSGKIAHLTKIKAKKSQPS